MCFFYTAPKWERIKTEYRVAAPADLFLISEYDRDTVYLEGFRYPKTAIITDISPEVATVAEWGLLPGWAKNKDLQKNTLNARIETVHEKAMFKNSITKRCLVPVESFTEWKWEQPGKSACKKHKHTIKVKDRDIFAFAGIYSVWNDITTFSVLTTDANELMADIHNNKLRMPVILKKEDEEAWLAKAPIEDFALPYQVELEAEPEEPFDTPLTLF